MPFPVTPRRCVCLLLAALLVAPGGLPGLAHAHPDAERPHHHEVDGDGDGAHRHGHEPHHQHETLAPGLEGAPSPHVHYSWFGFDLIVDGVPGADANCEDGSATSGSARTGDRELLTFGAERVTTWLAPWLVAS